MASTSGSCPSVIAQPVGVVGLEDPAAVGRDADRAPRRSGRGRARAARDPARHARDRVLAGPPAEHDGHPDALAHGATLGPAPRRGGPGADETGAGPLASPRDHQRERPAPVARDPRRVRRAAGQGARTPRSTCPVVLSSTFHAGGPVAYGRTSNPTWEALEDVVGALEGGRALAFSSGMAAVSAVLDLVPNGGTVVVSSHSYTGVAARLRDLEADGRVVREARVGAGRRDGRGRECAGADLLWLETPTNPTMEVCDLAAVAAAARELGVLTVCDNTFAAPMLQRPLDHGVDVVAALGHQVPRRPLRRAARHRRHDRRRLLRPPAAHPHARRRRSPGRSRPGSPCAGCAPCALRVEQSQANALQLALRLVDAPGRHRGALPRAARRPRARDRDPADGRLRRDRRLRDGRRRRRRPRPSATRVRLVTHATSLGGVETLVERRRRWPEERPDVPETLIRLSVGIEDVEDLWADLDQALTRSPTSARPEPGRISASALVARFMKLREHVRAGRARGARPARPAR